MKLLNSCIYYFGWILDISISIFGTQLLPEVRERICANKNSPRDLGAKGSCCSFIRRLFGCNKIISSMELQSRVRVLALSHRS